MEDDNLQRRKIIFTLRRRNPLKFKKVFLLLYRGCTAVKALELGLPTSLEGVAKCLKLTKQKMVEGKALIRYFSMPCSNAKGSGFRNRNLPQQDSDKWELFKSYCKQDVEVEKNEAITLTGIKNPKSTLQMKKWLLKTEGMEIETLSKETVESLLKVVTNEKVKRVLQLRVEISKTSIKKYEAMNRGLCRDNRIRGLLKFYGAKCKIEHRNKEKC